MKRELTGHSGCALNLIKKDGKLIVEKQAKNLRYNERLKIQCAKQDHFISDRLHAVKVIASGYKRDGLFYFDMDYISGITMAEYMREISLQQLDDLAGVLFNQMIQPQEYDPYACHVFYKKIEDLRKHIPYQDDVIQQALTLLKDYEWKYMIPSDCHGDFTLENILIAGNQIFLIDFLDSFYDSWMIDYAKILQDVELFWHYRHELHMDVNLRMRLLILKENLKNRILRLKDGKNLMGCIYHILLLNILRILPYTEEKPTIDFLIKKIKYVISAIHQQSWNDDMHKNN